MRREYYRRQHPEATETQLNKMVSDWILALHESELTIPGFRRRPLPPQ